MVSATSQKRKYILTEPPAGDYLLLLTEQFLITRNSGLMCSHTSCLFGGAILMMKRFQGKHPKEPNPGFLFNGEDMYQGIMP